MKTKIMKYKVTNMFGLQEIGEIIQCNVIAEGNGKYLVYHKPSKSRDECGAYEICKMDNDGFLISYDDESYVNDEE